MGITSDIPVSASYARLPGTRLQIYPGIPGMLLCDIRVYRVRYLPNMQVCWLYRERFQIPGYAGYTGNAFQMAGTSDVSGM